MKKTLGMLLVSFLLCSCKAHRDESDAKSLHATKQGFWTYHYWLNTHTMGDGTMCWYKSTAYESWIKEKGGKLGEDFLAGELTTADIHMFVKKVEVPAFVDKGELLTPNGITLEQLKQSAAESQQRSSDAHKQRLVAGGLGLAAGGLAMIATGGTAFVIFGATSLFMMSSASNPDGPSAFSGDTEQAQSEQAELYALYSKTRIGEQARHTTRSAFDALVDSVKEVVKNQKRKKMQVLGRTCPSSKVAWEVIKRRES